MVFQKLPELLEKWDNWSVTITSEVPQHSEGKILFAGLPRYLQAFPGELPAVSKAQNPSQNSPLANWTRLLAQSTHAAVTHRKPFLKLPGSFILRTFLFRPFTLHAKHKWFFFSKKENLSQTKTDLARPLWGKNPTLLLKQTRNKCVKSYNPNWCWMNEIEKKGQHFWENPASESIPVPIG